MCSQLSKAIQNNSRLRYAGASNDRFGMSRAHAGLQPHEISDALANRVYDLVHALVVGRPIALRNGRIRIGNQGSLSVDANTGLWFDHEAGIGGDALDLVRNLRQCDFREAVRWSRQWLGEDSGPAPSPQLPRHRRAPERAPNDQWRTILAAGVPCQGTPAERYLNGRGLALRADTPLLYHPACPRGADKLPAMIAPMTDPETNETVGIHRTFIKPDGSGKADVTPSKMMLGNAGVIRLTPNENVTTGLGVCEGLETGLAVLQTGWAPIWAATSAGGIAKFPALPGISALTIFADHDKPGTNGRRPGVDAARECAKRWLAAGREVTVWLPPDGKDWDDALRGNTP